MNKFYRQFITIIIVICLLILNVSIVTAQPDSTSPEEIAKAFLSTKIQSLVSRNSDDINGFFTDTTLGKKYLNFNKLSTLNIISHFAEGDYLIKRVNPNVTVENSTIKDNQATIEATVYSEIWWNAANPLGDDIVSKISEKHVFNFIKESNAWKITEDSFASELGKSEDITQQDLTLIEDTLKKTKDKVNNEIEKAKKSAPTKLEIVKNKKNNASKKTQAKYTIMSGTFYDKLAATNYAVTYAVNPNTAYKDMSQNGGGGDCTNFVSQCVRAGGGNNDTSGSYVWWYNNQGTSSTSDDTWVWTWASAYGFNYAVRGNYTQNEFGPKGYAITIIGDSNYNNSWGQYLQNGDIIQYASGDADSTISHSAIITTLIWNSSKNRYEPLISQHTDNLKDIPWTKNAYKTYFMFMTGVN